MAPTIFFLLLLVMFLGEQNQAAMTDKQYKSALKLVRNVCQSKAKLTDADIDGMRGGDWEKFDDNIKCYLYCLVNMYKLMKKDNSFDTDGMLKTLETQAPVSIRDAAIVSVKNCRNAVSNFDKKCVVAYEMVKCIYLDNPENYFLS